MAYRSSMEFLAALEREGELVRVPFPVATELEITAWADREMKSAGGGKALLFEQPTVNGVVSRLCLGLRLSGHVWAQGVQLIGGACVFAVWPR